MAYPLHGKFPTVKLQIVDADPPTYETTPSLEEVNESVVRLKGGEVPGV